MNDEPEEMPAADPDVETPPVPEPAPAPEPPAETYVAQARDVTVAHIARVAQLMNEAAARIVQRGRSHDTSKFEDDELMPLATLQEVIATEGPVEFGTPEYAARTALLGEMIPLHYARNDHHPEHFMAGVSDMDLFQLMEMVTDWKAASERGTGNLQLEAALQRFHIEEQLADVIRNTCENLGWDTA